ncbi:hypothetical protein GWQ44_20190 [Pseudomonas sp. 3MA1]|uniref:hypothetical protein n=1 Tax=Pseudomonas sp. 3MA1 TaxID=2699196 RepID=UPI0023DD70A0|nr:hypothetical protein [Pseudomonas sp. 3MA1]MDF2397874.1 hypothetical protein [Pseudomonas sp. 3MA1]
MEYVEYMRQQFGSDAADVRHELFYLHAGRSQVAAGIRALAALLRDSWLLLRCTSAGLGAQGHKQAILLTTLAGASGWSTLQRTLPALAAAGYAPLVVLHPRLAIDDISPALPCIRPARPGLQAWRSALRVFIATLRQAQPLLLASCLARRVLWSSSLRRTLAGSRGVVLLHNDFDLMSRAAIGQGLTSICVQHGIATDEFFPTQADCYLVWGDASRQVFEANGTPSAQLVEDALGRGERTEQATRAPEGIALLSQTHARILGEGIGEALATFAHALLQIAPDARILLHPQENQPYSGAAARATRRPPHPELRPGAALPQLVVGYCSTAMLEAALAGHWVVALQLELPGNRAVRQAMAAPLQAATAMQVASLYQRLRDDPAFRQATGQAQAQWLRSHFARQTSGLAGLLQRFEQPAKLESVA